MRMHIGESGGGIDTYTVFVHSPTPAGNNAVPAGAGGPITWVDAVKAAGRNATQMTVGNGIGMISNAEANSVTAGTVIETSFIWQDNPAWTTQQRTDDLNLRASQAVADAIARLQQTLKFFGATVA